MQGHPLTLTRTLIHTHTHTHTHLEPGTWDPCSLSHPFVTPTANLNTRAREIKLDVGTFGPNQYKKSCFYLYYHPSL